MSFRLTSAALGLLLALSLASCISPTRDDRGLPDDSGKTSREICTESCNRDYDICGDSSSASTTTGLESQRLVPGMFGTSAGCSDDLRDCLKDCRGAGIPDQK